MSGKERRAQLVEVGRQLFAEKGLEGTSVEEIAAKAGVSKPVVYEHFGGKEGLYAVVVDREMQTLLDAITSALTGGHPRELLEQAAFALLDYVEVHADGFRILVRDSGVGTSSGTFASLISDIATQVEHVLGSEFKARGFDARLAPMYSQMLVGMVALTGQWWLGARRRPRSPRTWSTSRGTACPVSSPGRVWSARATADRRQLPWAQPEVVTGSMTITAARSRTRST
jgi:AcrR family transcriptional regulator